MYIITKNDRKGQNTSNTDFEIAQKARILLIHPFQIIPMYLDFFCCEQRQGRGDYRLCPLSGTPGHLDWTILA